MDLCYAIKKNTKKENKEINVDDICNTKLTEKNKHEIKIDGKIIYTCGRHKNLKDISDFKIPDEKLQNITNDFNQMKLNQDEKENNEYREKKQSCLQHILFLISQDKNDRCQYTDCQFAHNIDIVYT